MKKTHPFKACRICKKANLEIYGGGYCIECYPKTNVSKTLQMFIDGYNLAEIGDYLGITRERARQIYNRAIDIEINRTATGLNDSDRKEMLKTIKDTSKTNRFDTKYNAVVNNESMNLESYIKENNVSSVSELFIKKDIPVKYKKMFLEKNPKLMSLIQTNADKRTSRLKIANKRQNTRKYKLAARARKENLLKKLGSDEAVSEYYRNIGKLSENHVNRRKGTAKGGFNYMNKEKLKKVAKLGGMKSIKN